MSRKDAQKNTKPQGWRRHLVFSGNSALRHTGGSLCIPSSMFDCWHSNVPPSNVPKCVLQQVRAPAMASQAQHRLPSFRLCCWCLSTTRVRS